MPRTTIDPTIAPEHEAVLAHEAARAIEAAEARKLRAELACA